MEKNFLNLMIVLMVAIMGFGFIGPIQAAPVFLYFDEPTLSEGERIDEQYATQYGLHFDNDYPVAGGGYEASPTITKNSQARSAPNILVNLSTDNEFYNSRNSAMSFWFEEPVNGVGMWLGAVDKAGGLFCGPSTQCTVTVYDCQGIEIDSETVTVNQNVRDNSVQILDSNEQIQKVVIDCGDSFCHEAIDELAFEIVPGTCQDPTCPKVLITTDKSTLVSNSAQRYITGYVQEDGILSSLRINGSSVPFSLNSAENRYEFHEVITLSPGTITYTVLAENSAGCKSADSITFTLGIPTSVSLGEFHLTQRGIMMKTKCDFDKPFVAGKSAVARVDLSAKSTEGYTTYVDAVDLLIMKKQSGGDVETSKIVGEIYGQYISHFTSPSHLSGVHFYIPGSAFDLAGEYQFKIQAYSGFTSTGLQKPVGQPIVVNCSGSYITFTETDPVKAYMVGAEVGMMHPSQSAKHVSDFYDLLAHVPRTFPIRDDYASYWSKKKAGFIYVEDQPLKFCDGSTNKINKKCGTGWTWQLIDKHVDDPTKPTESFMRWGNNREEFDLFDTNICCKGNPPNQVCRQTIGGSLDAWALTNDNAHRQQFNPQLGMIRTGAHPEWEQGKYFFPFDYNHSGAIDNNDMIHQIAEYFDEDDSTTPQWIQVNNAIANLANYDPGEAYRFFADQNGDQCNDTKDEPQADVRHLQDHARSYIDSAPEVLMQAFNQAHNENFKFSNLFLPTVVYPNNSNMGTWGPGSSKGKTSWHRLVGGPVLAHELAHCVAKDKSFLYDLYGGFDNNEPDDFVTKENAWLFYNLYTGKNRPAVNAYAVMAAGGDAFIKKHYQHLFDQLKTSSSSVSQDALAAAADTDQVLVSGVMITDNQAENVSLKKVSGLASTPTDSQSPYQLVLGQGSTVISEYPFTISWENNPPQGVSEEEIALATFMVIVPCPADCQWVELRYNDQVLARFDETAASPSVEVIRPNGGEAFAGEEQVVISWSVEDSDSEEVLSTISYSFDNGENWNIVAADVVGDEYNWDLGNARGTDGNKGLIKVVASDGFNQSQDQSNGSFSITGKPPQLIILAPQPDQDYLGCETVYLHGAVYDPENQLQNVTWQLNDQDTDFELVDQVKALEVGSYSLTLTAYDSDGFSESVEVNFTVLSDLDCDGMSDQFEQDYGFDIGLVDDATADPDKDNLINLDESWYKTKPDDADSDDDGFNDGEEVEAGTDPTDPESKPCRTNVDCSDDNDCTDDTCGSNGRCSFIPNANSCDDGQFCNGQDTCQGGACVSAGNPCPNSVCDEINDQCQGCESDDDCDKGNLCTDDICQSDGSCQSVNNIASCDDNLFCNGDDNCEDGYCSAHAGDPCKDGEQCDETNDTCTGGDPCKIRLDPDQANVFSADTLQFKVETEGDCEDLDLGWSVQTNIASQIDQDGNYTAGENPNFFAQAQDTVKIVDHDNDLEAEAQIMVSVSCFLFRLFGEGSEEVALLRAFRDDVLNQTPEGREMIDLYYRLSPFIYQEILKDEALAESIKNDVQNFLGTSK